DGDRCDNRVAAILIKRIHQQVEAARLNRARDLDLIAELPRQIDIEPGRIAVRSDIIERRIIELDEKPDRLDTRNIPSFGPTSRIPEPRNGRPGRQRYAVLRHKL